MGIYKKPRNRYWWMSLSVNGQQVRRSTGTDQKTLAQKIFYKAKTLIAEGKWFEPDRAKVTRFSDLVAKYLEHNGKSRDEHTVKRLLPVFGQMSLSEITSEKIEEYRQRRLLKVKPATIYQELSFMRHIFNVARRSWKLVKENPAADLSFAVGNSNARDRWLTHEEEWRLLEAATNPGWMRTMLTVALHTGMRKGEILALKWQDLDFRRAILTVQKSKNGEKRGIPMSETLQEALSAYKKATQVIEISGRVLPLSNSSVDAAFRKVKKKAGIEDFRFHDLRHTFATRLVQGGVDLYKVQKLLGHKNIMMTQRYSHHYPESLRSSVEVLDRLSPFYHPEGHKDSQAGGQNG